MNTSDSSDRSVWEDDLRVRSFDVDCYGRLKLSTLFNYLEDAAGRHATSLQAGYDVLKELGLFWVLSRARVRVHRLPAWGERVHLTTWPKGLNGVLFLRDFRVTGSGLEPLVECSTGWLLLDVEHYKPHLPEALPAAIPPNALGHAIEEPLRKLRPVEGLVPVREHTVVASEIDVNNHVNNARYVEWVMDCYSPDELAARQVDTLQINYVGETTYGGVIRLFRGVDVVGGTDYIEGVNNASGAKVMQAAIAWK